ncbi:MAG: RHS repeat-associated core domain-containing protein [Acidobacteriota bacterium]
MAVPNPLSNAGLGWSLSLGRLLYPDPDLPHATALHPGRWTYVGADGGRHGFHDRLHPDVPAPQDQQFTTDGSYLRMRVLPAGHADCQGRPRPGEGCRVVDHPDGRSRIFVDISPSSGGPEDWRPSRLHDAFGNALDIAYGTHTWTLTDRHQRVATVTFGGPADRYERIETVDLPAFGGERAVYEMEYATTLVDRHRYSVVEDLQCASFPVFPDRLATASVDLLTGIGLPDDTYYSFDYGTTDSLGAGTKSGSLRTARTPTGLWQRFEYGLYDFLYPSPQGLEAGRFATNVLWGVVAKERFADASLRESLGRFTYRPGVGGGFDLNGPDAELCYQTTTVRDPLGHETRHYFSTTRRHDPSLNGLPITLCDPAGGSAVVPGGLCPDHLDGGRCFLSQEVFGGDAASGTLVRRTWRSYENEGDGISFDERNNRLRFEAVEYLDDLNGALPHWRSTEHSDYDGLGHYRRTDVDASYPEGDNDRNTYTHHNPGAGTYPGSFQMPTADDPWHLEKPAYVEVVEGPGHRTRTDFCYADDTPFLLGSRLRNGPAQTATDVLTRFERDAKGNVTSVRTWGGDTSTDLPLGCDGLPTAEPTDHRVHRYAHGVRASTEIVDLCDSVLLTPHDVTVDRNSGLVASSRDVAGVETAFDYDLTGRLLREAPSGSAWIRHDYSLPTPLTPDADVRYTRTACAEGSDPCAPIRWDRHDYDRLGRIVRSTRPVPSGEVATASRTTAYNALGWVVAQSEWGLPEAETQFTDFDRFGRAATVTRPDGGVTHFTFTGDRGVEQRDTVEGVDGPLLRRVEAISDARGRLVRLTEPSGPDGGEVDTTYAYDEGDRIVRVCVDASAGACGQIRTFDYDPRGFLTAASEPEGATVRYTYDALGRALSRRLDGDSANRFALDTTYDAAGRVTQVHGFVPGSSQTRLLVEHAYARGSENGAGGRGKPAVSKRHHWIPSGGGERHVVVSELWSYGGPGGRVSSLLQRASNGVGFRTDLTAYDDLGNVTKLGYPQCTAGTGCENLTAFEVEYGYTRGQLTSITDFASSIGYLPDLRLASLAHANGVTETRVRDASGRLARISTTGVTDGNWDTGSFAYDDAGNLVAIGAETFTYDEANRLVTATVDLDRRGTTLDTRSRSYRYDAYGNLRAIEGDGSPVGSISVDESTNRLAPSLAQYDPAGQITSLTLGGQTWRYTHDALGRMSTLERGADRHAYLYTASGERFASLDLGTGAETYTPRGLGNEVLRRFVREDDAWRLETSYVYAGTRLAARVSPSATEHVHVDHLGSTRLVTDGAGATRRFTTHYPYGELATAPSPGSDPLQFTGHERDPHGGAGDLDYMHARYLTPRLGRFLSMDPAPGSADRPQSWNRYAYGNLDPVSVLDPDGREGTRFQRSPFGIGIDIGVFSAKIQLSQTSRSESAPRGRNGATRLSVITNFSRGFELTAAGVGLGIEQRRESRALIEPVWSNTRTSYWLGSEISTQNDPSLLYSFLKFDKERVTASLPLKLSYKGASFGYSLDYSMTYGELLGQVNRLGALPIHGLEYLSGKLNAAFYPAANNAIHWIDATRGRFMDFLQGEASPLYESAEPNGDGIDYED